MSYFRSYGQLNPVESKRLILPAPKTRGSSLNEGRLFDGECSLSGRVHGAMPRTDRVKSAQSV